MHRRRFLQGVTASAGSMMCFSSANALSAGDPTAVDGDSVLQQACSVSAAPEGYSFLSAFQYDGESWKAYEDLRTRDGSMLLISASNETKLLTKTAEPTSTEGVARYLGLTLDQIVESLPDLLARQILQQGGDPNPELVKSAVPPWDPGQQRTFIGTKECWDTQPVYLPIRGSPRGERKEGGESTYCGKMAEMRGIVGPAGCLW